MVAKYINPFTDFGFKRLFGEEASKDLLKSFLNELLEGEQVIRELTYLETEQLGGTQFDRKAIFDLYCENDKGEKFIVELQRAKQKFFKDRTIFYSTFPLREQAMPNDWDFRLRSVYTIAILDFELDDGIGDEDTYRYDVQLMERKFKKVFYDKLTYIYLIMPKFKKGVDELKTGFDKWLYAIKHLCELQARPDNLSERIFERFFEKAAIAQFSPAEHVDYEASLKIYRDWKNTLDTAHDEGFDEGFEEGMKTIARKMLAVGESVDRIAQLTGLSEQQVRKLGGEE